MNRIIRTVMEMLGKFALPLCAGLLACCGMFFFLFLRQHHKAKGLASELEVQRERVMARKKKIAQLKQTARQERTKRLDVEEKLLSSYTQEEITSRYAEIAKAFRETGEQIHDAMKHTIDQADAAQFSQIMTHLSTLADLVRSAFRIEEPLELFSPEKEVIEPLDEQEQEKQRSSAAKRRILVTEDNELNMRTAVEVLETNGYIVDQATSGEEALEKFNMSRDGYYAMVLMDIVMPGKSGYDVSREIRKGCRGDSERIPIIAMTANDFVEDLVRIQDAGMNDRVVKPLTEQNLLLIVRKWLEADTKETEDEQNWNNTFKQVLEEFKRVVEEKKPEDKTEDEQPFFAGLIMDKPAESKAEPTPQVPAETTAVQLDPLPEQSSKEEKPMEFSITMPTHPNDIAASAIEMPSDLPKTDTLAAVPAVPAVSAVPELKNVVEHLQQELDEQEKRHQEEIQRMEQERIAAEKTMLTAMEEHMKRLRDKESHSVAPHRKKGGLSRRKKSAN